MRASHLRPFPGAILFVCLAVVVAAPPRTALADVEVDRLLERAGEKERHGDLQGAIADLNRQEL